MSTDWSKYKVLDGVVETAKYVLPLMPCGIYRHTSMFDEVTELTFRYIPRAAKHRGKFGVFAEDPDAGAVLIGLHNPATAEIDRVGTLYPNYWECWLGAVLVERRCAWCGRKMNDEQHEAGVKIHPNCRDKA